MFVKTEERPAGEPAKVGTLKLSEAIRIGSKMRPPNRGTTFLCDGACAVGAAYIAVYGEKECERVSAVSTKVREYFGVSEELWNTLGISLRFGRGETREQIADWLESRGL